VPEIRFKATRRKHDSGYRIIEKRGDMEYDADRNSKDGIWLWLPDLGRISIDCDGKTGEFRVFFGEGVVKKQCQ